MTPYYFKTIVFSFFLALTSSANAACKLTQSSVQDNLGNFSGLPHFGIEADDDGHFPVFLAASEVDLYCATANGNVVAMNHTSPCAFLRYQEDYRTKNVDSLGRSIDDKSFFSFSVSSFNQTSDECVVLFNDQASNNYERNFDAEKLMSKNPAAVNCALVSADAVLMEIDSRPYADILTTIPVYVDMPTAGQYIFEILEVNNMPLGTCLFVEDLITGDIIPLTVGETYTMNISKPFIGNRFLIHTSPSADVTTQDATCFNSENGAIQLDIVQGEWSVVLEGANGIVSFGNNIFQFKNLSAGDYQVYLTPMSEQCQSAIVPVTIQQPKAEIFEWTNSDIDYCGISTNGMIEWSFIGVSFYEYELVASDGSMIASGVATSPDMMLDHLTGDVYGLNITTACTAATYPVNIKDPNAITLEIIDEEINVNLVSGVSQTVAIEQNSSNETSLIWSMDNGYASYDDMFIYNFDQPGEYTVMLLASNDECSAADFIQISVTESVAVKEQVSAPYVSMVQRQNAIDFSFFQVSDSKTKAFMYDMGGKLVWSNEGQAESGTRITADLTSMPEGEYTVLALVNELPLLSRNIMR